MARSSCCPLLAAVVSFLAGGALMSYLTCDGADCFALENLEVARISSYSKFTSQVPVEPNLEKVERPVDVYGGPSWVEDEQTAKPQSRVHEAEGREPPTTPESLGVLRGDAVDPDIVIFGTDFYPDGRFHPDTGFDPYAPATSPVIPTRAVALNIVDFGGIGDGTTVNTAAFEAAIAAASEVQDEGGALLLVPEGVWLTGCFNLTSHFTLFLESGAVLLASEEPSEWAVLPPLPSYGQGRDHEGPRYGSFIHGEHLTDVVITGNNGTINGQGGRWWADYKAGQLNHTRGCLVELQWSSNLVISNLTLLDSPFWNVHLYDSHDVTVHGLTIVAPSHSKNTDGVDPDSCTDVLIENCFISTGDDAIAVKSGMDAAGVAYGKPTRNVVVRNLVVGRTHALSIGSEMSGGVANVLFQNIVSVGPGDNGLRIKSAPGRGGYVTNVTYRDIVLENQKYAISVYSNYRQDAATEPAKDLPRLEGFLFQNVTGRHIVYAGRLNGLPQSPLRGLKLEEVHLDSRKRYKCDDVYVDAENAEPAPCSQGWDSQQLANGRRGLQARWLWTRRQLRAVLGMPAEWSIESR